MKLVVLILFSIIALAYCSNSELKNRMSSGSSQYGGGVCRPDERNRQCFAYNPKPSCICYFNGRCENGMADRCTDCGNKNIYSITDGYCRDGHGRGRGGGRRRRRDGRGRGRRDGRGFDRF